MNRLSHKICEIRLLDCREVTPEQAGFPGARLMVRLQRRVRRPGKKSTETVYLISRLTLEPLNAMGWIRLTRGDWIIESRLHHALDVSLEEDRSRVRHPNAALVLGMFRRRVVSVAQAALEQVQTQKTRWSVRRYQQRFARRRPRTPPRSGVRQIPDFLALRKMKRRALRSGR